jgi:hypothetical protein
MIIAHLAFDMPLSEYSEENVCLLGLHAAMMIMIYVW